MKQRFFYLVFIIFAFASMFLSCKKSSTNAPVVNTNLATGTWSGTVVNTMEHDSFPISFTMQQTGSSITGEFLTAAAPGNVTGSLSGNSVTLTLTPAVSSGYTEIDTFKGTLNTAGSEITGTFNSTNVGESGTFDIKKQ